MQKPRVCSGLYLLILTVKNTILILVWLLSNSLFSQSNFPFNRFSDWQHAGQTEFFDSAFVQIDMNTLNIDPTGQVDCSQILQNAIDQYDHVIFKFPAGEFMFESPISLKAHQVLEGSGPESTHFIFNSYFKSI